MSIRGKKCFFSNADVLVPQRRLGGDEILHHLDALGVLQHLHRHAVRAQMFLVAQESFIFADDDVRNFVELDRAGTHGAGRQRRVNRAALIDFGGQAAGIFERVHLAVMDDAAVLHALVVAAPDDFAVADQHRADGNAARRETFFRLVNGRL